MDLHLGPTPVVCGHRGAAAVAAENTLASFDAAVARGATWVEFDVRPAAGGVFVVHHDPVTADGVHIATTDVDRLATSIPTLAAVADRCAEIGLDIELKTDDVAISARDYVDLVGAEIDAIVGSRSAPCVVTSFDAELLALFRTDHPAIPTGLLFHDSPFEEAVAAAVAAGHAAVAPWYRLVEPPLVAAAHAAGLKVLTWTVNTAADVERVVAAGVDMIIGDDPAVIVETLAAPRDAS